MVGEKWDCEGGGGGCEKVRLPGMECVGSSVKNKKHVFRSFRVSVGGQMMIQRSSVRALIIFRSHVYPLC